MRLATHSTINGHDQPCNPASFFTAKKQNCYIKCSVECNLLSMNKEILTIADIPPSSFYLHQILVDSSLSHLIRHSSSSDHRRKNHSRADTIDSDVFGAMLSCHRSGHLDDSSFWCGVQQTWVSTEYLNDFSEHDLQSDGEVAHTTAHWRHIDDCPSTVFPKLWNDMSAHEHHTRHVDSEVTVPSIHIYLRCISHRTTNPN